MASVERRVEASSRLEIRVIKSRVKKSHLHDGPVSGNRTGRKCRVGRSKKKKREWMFSVVYLGDFFNDLYKNPEVFWI